MPQSELLNIGQTRYTHIGKLEDNAPTLELWKAHLGSQGWTEDFELPHTNRGLLRLLPGSLGEETLAAVRVIYSKDYELFGYTDAPPATADLSGASPRPDQNVQVAPETLAAMREIIDRHERIADLQQMLCGALEAAAVAQTDLAKSVHRQGDLERRLFEQTIAARDFRIELARAARKTA
jgi:hypothetical protein